MSHILLINYRLLAGLHAGFWTKLRANTPPLPVQLNYLKLTLFDLHDFKAYATQLRPSVLIYIYLYYILHSR